MNGDCRSILEELLAYILWIGYLREKKVEGPWSAEVIPPLDRDDECICEFIKFPIKAIGNIDPTAAVYPVSSYKVTEPQQHTAPGAIELPSFPFAPLSKWNPTDKL